MRASAINKEGTGETVGGPFAKREEAALAAKGLRTKIREWAFYSETEAM